MLPKNPKKLTLTLFFTLTLALTLASLSDAKSFASVERRDHTNLKRFIKKRAPFPDDNLGAIGAAAAPSISSTAADTAAVTSTAADTVTSAAAATSTAATTSTSTSDSVSSTVSPTLTLHVIYPTNTKDL